MSAEPHVHARGTTYGYSTETAAYAAAFRSGTVADPYAAIEHAIAAESLASHGGDDVMATRAESPIALLVAGQPGDVVAVGPATQLLTVGSPLVLYRSDEITCRALRSLGDEELYAVDIGSATGTVLCARTACPTCESIPTRLRCRAGGYLCGLTQGAIDTAIGRVSTRVQFGRPVGNNQTITFQLAALTARMTAMHALGQHIATQIQASRDAIEADLARQCSSWLAACAELAIDATTTALHLHGAYGLLADQDAQHFYRKACGFSNRHGAPSRLRLAHSSRTGASR